MRLKRIAWGGLAAILLSVLLLTAVLYWLVATESGLRRLAGEIESRVPGATVERTEGSLLGGVVLSGLAYRDAAIEARLDRLEIRWDPAALRRRVFHARSIRAEGLHVVVTGESASSEPPAWPAYRFPFDMVIDDFQLRNGNIRIRPAAEPIRIDRLDTGFSLNREGLNIVRLDAALPEAEAKLSGRVGLSGARAVDLKTEWRLSLPDRPELKGAGTIAGDPQRLDFRQTLHAPMAAELTAELANPLATLSWTAQLDVPRFSPAQIDPAWKPWPATLNLKGQGTAAEAAVEGGFSAAIPDMGEARGQMRSRYRAPGDIAVETLTLALPRTGTDIVLDGTVRSLWDKPSFTLAAHWRNLVWPLAPRVEKNEWRSPEGRLAVTGNPQDIRFDLDGKLRERRVEAGGNIGFEAERTVFRGVRVRGAGAAVALDGVLGPRVDFAWTLKADDLGLWVPGARGQVNSRGTLQGPREAPAIEAEFAAHAVQFQDKGADDVKLTLKAGLQPDSPFVFDLSADAVRVAGQRLETKLVGQGTRARHRLTGWIDNTAGDSGLKPTLQFLAEGGFQNEAWTGTFVQFDFNATPVGHWVLRQPAALRFGKAGGELGRACWNSGETEACLQGALSGAGDWRMAAEVSRLPLARFREAVPEAAALSGLLSGTADFAGKGGHIREGQLALNGTEARLEFRANAKDTLSFRPDPLSLRAVVSERATELRLAAEQPGFASIRGDIGIEGPLDLARLKQAPLAGDLAMDLQNLAILDPWTQDIEALQGTFNAGLRLSGTVAAPAVELQAAVPEAGFSVPRLGIRVRKVALQARAVEAGKFILDGRAVSGDGEIRLNGTGILDAAAGWPLDLTLRGNRFLAADLPEAKIYASPDLAIAFARGRLALKGAVTVPEAAIKIPEQAGAVKPSEDVVVIGAERQPEADGLPIEAHVDVVLGDKIRVGGAGFDGRVEGRVLVEQAPRGPVLGTGQIAIRDGKYSFYGVELAIDTGRLLFAHSPVDNPNLDIDVTRRTETSPLAGLKVLGTLKKPNITLYSDTPMAQTDILAYLVTGKPLGLASRQEGSALQQAAASLGGAAGNLLAREIGSRLGLGGFLDDISVQSSLAGQDAFAGRRSVETSSGAQNTALFLGKYLTPRLYVQYGVGLLQGGNVFRLRYELSKHWKLQTETGDYSGGDIFYQWEK
jgi:translocation and assembly module TamB